MGSRPLQIFSTMMVGAPIIWGNAHQRIVGDLVRRDELDFAVFANRLDGHQLADVRGRPRRPAPRTVAPSAISSISLTPIILRMENASPFLNLEGCFSLSSRFESCKTDYHGNRF